MKTYSQKQASQLRKGDKIQVPYTGRYATVRAVTVLDPDDPRTAMDGPILVEFYGRDPYQFRPDQMVQTVTKDQPSST